MAYRTQAGLRLLLFDNSDELTYRDGEGFITEYPEAVERSAVTGIHSLVANALIIYIVINILVTAVDYFTPFKTVHDLSYNSLGFSRAMKALPLL